MVALQFGLICHLLNHIWIYLEQQKESFLSGVSAA